MKDMNKHIAPKTEFPKMATGYTVPEGYFETFGDRMNARLKAETPPQLEKSQLKGILFYLKPAMGLAAGLALLLLVYSNYKENQSVILNFESQNAVASPMEDSSDLLPLPNVFAYVVTENQFFSALTDIDEYDASKISKEGLVEYLASNCSDFEIINANK